MPSLPLRPFILLKVCHVISHPPSDTLTARSAPDLGVFMHEHKTPKMLVLTTKCMLDLQVLELLCTCLSNLSLFLCTNYKVKQFKGKCSSRNLFGKVDSTASTQKQLLW